jgi:triacylglycerol lipase
MATVLLIHGLGAQRWMLRPLEQVIRQHGFDALTWGYSSVGRSITTHAQQFRALLQQVNDASQQFHVVSHSMGGIILRAAVDGMTLPSAGRLVMLGPPNSGSRVARSLARWLNPLCPALGDLSDAPGSFVNRLPPPMQFETGVIAAAHDHVVALSSTHIPGERDHTIVPCRHGMLLFHRQAAEQTVAFLRQGSFLATHPASAPSLCREP